MHELSIVEAIVDTAIPIAKENNAKKILKIYLKVGELSGIVESCVKEYFKEVSKGTIAQDGEIIVEVEPVKIKCLDCGYTGNSVKPHGICPKCHKENINVISGNDYYIDHLEVE